MKFFFIGSFEEFDIRNPELPSKMLGSIIVCKVVFRFFLRLFTVRKTTMRTSLQIMDMDLQMSFGRTLYLLLSVKTFSETTLGF